MPEKPIRFLSIEDDKCGILLQRKLKMQEKTVFAPKSRTTLLCSCATRTQQSRAKKHSFTQRGMIRKQPKGVKTRHSREAGDAYVRADSMCSIIVEINQGREQCGARCQSRPVSRELKSDSLSTHLDQKSVVRD